MNISHTQKNVWCYGAPREQEANHIPSEKNIKKPK